MAEKRWSIEEVSRFWDGLDEAADRKPQTADRGGHVISWESLDAETQAWMRGLHALAIAAPPEQARTRLDSAMQPLLASPPRSTSQPTSLDEDFSNLPWRRVSANGSAPGTIEKTPKRRDWWRRLANIHGRTWKVALAAALLILLAGAGVYLFSDRRDDEPGAIPAAVLESVPEAPAEPTGASFVWETKGGTEPLVDPTDLTIDPAGRLWATDGARSIFQIFTLDGEFLETWGETGSENGQFNFARGNVDGAVAFDSAGNLYVVDSGNHRVQKFNNDREFLTAWGSEGNNDGQFSLPADIAIDNQNRVFVLDAMRKDVQVFDSDGRYLFTFGGPGIAEGKFTFPTGVAVGPDGRAWIVDSDSNRIQAFDADGTFQAEFGKPGVDAGQLRKPYDVAVDQAGRIFVSEAYGNRVQVFDPDGKSLAIWGESGSSAGKFAGPGSIAVDYDGGVYVSDTDRVQKFQLRFSPDAAAVVQESSPKAAGEPAVAASLRAMEGAPDSLTTPTEIALAPDGQSLVGRGETGGDDGHFRNPWSIALDKAGSIYVSDFDLERVYKFATGFE